jgi:predicted small lipoprotein YifL
MMRTGVVLGVLLLLAGCGQKGPLYLPDKSPSVVTTPPAQGSAPAATPAGPNAPKKPNADEPDPAATPATPK